MLSRLIFILTLALALSARGAAAAGHVSLELHLANDQATRGGDSALNAIATIEPGWHINAHEPNEPFLIPTELKLTLPPGISSGTIRYPAPEKHSFQFAPGKELLVHAGAAVISTTIQTPTEFIGSKVRIEAVLRYQACNDTTCSPPASATAEILVTVGGTAPGASSITTGSDDGEGASDSSSVDFGGWLKQRGLPVTLLLVMLLGLGLNLTPCVYPLISVTLAFFSRHGAHRTSRVLFLASLYVAGITISFASVGVAAALSGGIFGAALQKPIVLIALAALMIVLALGSFGVYQFHAPHWLLQRLGTSAHGAFFMGLTMGVVAAPCVGPVVAGLLIYVGSQQSVLLGIELFSALGLGMGLPYIGLALTAGSLKKLPRSGAWLLWVERFFGFMLLGLALYFVAPLIPRSVSRFAMPALIAAAAFYLGFIDPSGKALPRFRVFQRVAGVVGLIAALWMSYPPGAEASLPWQPYEAGAIAAAKRHGQPVIIDFVADWCIPCHEMDSTTWADTQVQRATDNFVLLRANLTTENATTSALTDAFQVQGVPTIIFLDTQGHEAERLVGYVTAAQMTAALRRVSRGAAMTRTSAS